MIELSENTQSWRLILRPNRSADWQFNKYLLMALGGISFVIAAGFALIGAWVIIPFAGLEILALSLALYWVCWKLSFCHCITIKGDQCIIEKGVYYPRQSWQWTVDATSVAIQVADGSALPKCFLQSSDGRVQIGDFLDERETQDMIRALQQSQLPIRSFGPSENIDA